MADRGIRDILNNAEGYEYALLTSFNFDFTFFERSILPILWSHRIQKISLFIDADQLAESAQEIRNGSCAVGRNYMISPIRVPGAFHSKVILLLGRQRAKVIIASANLTLSGYFHNGEVFSEIDYDNQHPDGLGAILEAIRFFEQSCLRSHQLDKPLFEEIKGLLYYGKQYLPSDRLVLTNMERSLFEQIRSICPTASRIDIASPYYDNNLIALSELRSAYPDAELHIYLQNRKCRISADALKMIPNVHIHVYKEYVVRDKVSKRFFHGKVMCFTEMNGSLIVYGSANCTASALLKTPDAGGNVECVIADRGKPGEFASFFERFCQVPETLESEPLSYQVLARKNFTFCFGVLPENSQTIELYFDHNCGGNPIEVSLWDKALSFEKHEKGLKVYLPIDELDSSDNIIEVTIRFGDIIENISCWYINLAALKNHRIIDNSSSIREIDYSATGDRFAQDMLLLLEGLILSPDEERQRQARKMAVEGSNQTSDEEDDSSDGIVSYVLPSVEDAEKHHIDKITARILSERSIHLSEMIHGLPGEQEIKRIKEFKGGRTVGKMPTQRAATSAEKRFSGFYKRRTKNLFSKEFIAMSDYRRFLDTSSIFLELLDKYSLVESVEEVFQTSYIIQTRAKIILAVLAKSSIETDVLLTDKTIYLAVDAILKNGFIGLVRHGDADPYNKEILMALENRFHLRESTEGYTLDNAILKSISCAEKSNIPSLSHPYATRYLSDLYGCKRWTEVCELLRMDYGNDVTISKEQEEIIVVAKLNNLVYIIKEQSFFELRRYATRNDIKRASIVIQKKGEPKSIKHAIEVRFDVDFVNGKGKQTVRYQSGDQTNPTSFPIW